jgi:hypothetical protein
VELLTNTQKLYAQYHQVNVREIEQRAVGVAVDEATALLKAGLTAGGEVGHSQVEKAISVLSRALK